MINVTTTEKLNEKFRQVFDDDSIEVKSRMTAELLPPWLSHASFLR
jgi:hypothetical protein